MKRYADDIKTLLSSKLFVISILIIAIISYGFAATNVSISIDDLNNDKYVGSGNEMLQAGRFGMNLTYLLRGGRWYNSYSTDIIAVIFLIWAAINFCTLFRRVSRNHISITACTVFSCVMISYPLMNEIWEYTGANAVVSVGFFLDSLAILVIYELLHSSTKHTWEVLVASAAMMWVCAGYESLVSVYIFCVFAILALQVMFGDEKERKFSIIIRQGMVYAGVLALGIILRLVVHRITLTIMGLEPITNGSARIYWLEYPVKNVIINFVYHFILDYIIYALIYLPIAEFVGFCVIFAMIGIQLCKKHGNIMLLPWFGIFLSLFILGLVWGECPPYRTCQVFAIFAAFVSMMTIYVIENNKKRSLAWTRYIAYSVALGLCLFQAIYLNYFLTLNYLRSEEEAAVIRSVGVDLLSNYDDEKPVVFVGEYELSDSILEQASISECSLAWKLYDKVFMECRQVFKRGYNPSRKIPHTNINSVLAWSISVENGQKQMYELFKYYGYNYMMANHYTDYPEAVDYANRNKMPSYPKKGYIEELEKYYVVRLGEKIQ